MHLSERLCIYSYLSNKEIITKIMALAKMDFTYITESSPILREGRHAVLRLPKFDTVKAEREAHYQKSKASGLVLAKARLALRRYNCVFCLKEEKEFGWSLKKLIQYVNLHETLELRFERVKD